MRNALRMAVVVVLASAANVLAAEVPFTDGDIDFPSGTVQQQVAKDELGGGAGEPGRATAEEKQVRREPAPRSRAETETEAELWMDRGGE